MRLTHLIQLVAEVNGVDIVAFQIREHDNLSNNVSLPEPRTRYHSIGGPSQIKRFAKPSIFEKKLTKNTMQNSNPAAISTPNKNNQPTPGHMVP